MQTTTLKQTPQGEYVKRTATAKTVYIRGAYDAGTKRYSLIDAEDMNREIFLKGNTPVYVGFEY
jgi:hypothetical protein